MFKFHSLHQSSMAFFAFSDVVILFSFCNFKNNIHRFRMYLFEFR
nr:MAG TPA: hypothetical protein [Caudoviricetes sp.]